MAGARELDRIDREILRRLQADATASLAEIGWATTRATDEDFFARLVQQGRRWDAAGINHRSVGGAKPWQQGGTGLRRRPADHGGPDA